jgi:hypothetical protein
MRSFSKPKGMMAKEITVLVLRATLQTTGAIAAPALPARFAMTIMVG